MEAQANNHMVMPLEAKAACYISSAMGGLMQLQEHEQWHSKRNRQIAKCLEQLQYLFLMYPDSDTYDLIRLGHRFHTRMETELDIMVHELTQYHKENK